MTATSSGAAMPTAAGVEHLLAAHIVARHQTDGLGQLIKPFSDLLAIAQSFFLMRGGAGAVDFFAALKTWQRKPARLTQSTKLSQRSSE
jgi:hypothetical protein